MTRWLVHHGDILDAEADGLICSANPNLNLSGGVGGALLVRCGTQMQEFLHGYLRANGRRLVEPGQVVLAPPCGTPFKAVCHAVAIDVFYDTSADLIRSTYEVAIRELAAASCRTIAAACLGCGYGRCTIPLFVGVVRDLLPLTFNGVDAVTFASTNRDLTDALAAAIDAASD